MTDTPFFDSEHDNDESTDAVLYSPDELPQAVARMAETDGWRAALALETSHWDRFVSTHPQSLLASIRSLPGEAFIELPSLLVAVNYLQHVVIGDDPLRFHDVDHGVPPIPDQERDPLDRLIASAGRTAGHRTSGRLPEAVRAAVEGRRILDSLSPTQRTAQRMALPHLLLQWGRTLEVADLGGRVEYEEAWDLANLTGQQAIARRAAASLAWFHADHGRLNEAETWIARGTSIATVEPRYDAPLHLAAALVAIDRRDTDSTTVHLAGLASVPIGEYRAAEIWVRGWAAASESEMVEVERLLAGYRESQPTGVRTTGAFARYLAAAHGRLSSYREKTGPLLDVDSEPTTVSHMMSAVAAYRSGSMVTALQNVGLALHEDPGPRLRSSALLIAAAARLSLGRFDAAADAFATAHAIIEIEQLYSSYSTIAPEHVRELSAATGLPVRVSPAASGSAASSGAALASLSRRERQVLISLASEASLQTIADELFVSRNTVKSTTSSLYRKLGVSSRQAAVDLAHRAGIV